MESQVEKDKKDNTKKGIIEIIDNEEETKYEDEDEDDLQISEIITDENKDVKIAEEDFRFKKIDKSKFKSNIKSENRKKKLYTYRNRISNMVSGLPLGLAKFLDVVFNFFTIISIAIAIVFGLQAIYNGKWITVIVVSLFIYVVSIINDKISI